VSSSWAATRGELRGPERRIKHATTVPLGCLVGSSKLELCQLEGELASLASLASLLARQLCG